MKKTIALLAVAAAVFSLVGCTGDDSLLPAGQDTSSDEGLCADVDGQKVASRDCRDPNVHSVQGVCAGHGTERCENGQWSGVCDNAPRPEQSDVCWDGLDNNCDGRADEGCDCQSTNVGAVDYIPPTGMPCGPSLGLCAGHQGRIYCDSGRESECEAPRDGAVWVTPVTEGCNSLDDDCDGAVDEGLPLNSCGVCGAVPIERTCPGFCDLAGNCAAGAPTYHTCQNPTLGTLDQCPAVSQSSSRAPPSSMGSSSSGMVRSSSAAPVSSSAEAPSSSVEVASSDAPESSSNEAPSSTETASSASSGGAATSGEPCQVVIGGSTVVGYYNSDHECVLDITTGSSSSSSASSAEAPSSTEETPSSQEARSSNSAAALSSSSSAEAPSSSVEVASSDAPAPSSAEAPSSVEGVSSSMEAPSSAEAPSSTEAASSAAPVSSSAEAPSSQEQAASSGGGACLAIDANGVELTGHYNANGACVIDTPAASSSSSGESSSEGFEIPRSSSASSAAVLSSSTSGAGSSSSSFVGVAQPDNPIIVGTMNSQQRAEGVWKMEVSGFYIFPISPYMVGHDYWPEVGERVVGCAVLVDSPTMRSCSHGAPCQGYMPYDGMGMPSLKLMAPLPEFSHVVCFTERPNHVPYEEAPPTELDPHAELDLSLVCLLGQTNPAELGCPAGYVQNRARLGFDARFTQGSVNYGTDTVAVWYQQQ
ncbi:MAG: MopE-related protein [bacterium]